jgi:hypothetical protein
MTAERIRTISTCLAGLFVGGLLFAASASAILPGH